MDPYLPLGRRHCLRSNGNRVKVRLSPRYKRIYIEVSGGGFTYRVYVITGKNKLLGGALALVIVAELCSAMFSVVWFALGPCEFPTRLSFDVCLRRPLVQPLPEVNLDPFKICIYKRWETGELMYYGLAMLFGTSSPSAPRGCYYSNLRILTHVHYIFWSWNRRFSRIRNRCGDSEEIKDPGR